MYPAVCIFLLTTDLLSWPSQKNSLAKSGLFLSGLQHLFFLSSGMNRNPKDAPTEWFVSRSVGTSAEVLWFLRLLMKKKYSSAHYLKLELEY